MSKYKNTETMKIAEAAKLMHKNPLDLFDRALLTDD